MSSIIPANNSGSGGSASNETVPQFSNSISSFFLPNKSTESSESNERHPQPQFSDSISTYFPPNKSTESSESNERHPKPQFSDSISSYFPPNKSTESSEPSDTSTNESIHIHQSTSTRLLEFEDLHFGEVKHHLQLAEDNNNWRPNPSQGPVVGGGGGGGGVGGGGVGAPGDGGGEAAMDSVDWRTQLQPHFRQRILNNIMETLKRHLHVFGQEGLHEPGNIAIRLEENIYTAATSQSDYLAKIYLKLLTLETQSQNPIGNALPSNSAGNSNKSPDAASLDYSTAQTGHVNGAGWQEEVYQKIKTMKDLYLPEISEMYQKIAAKLQQHDSLLQQSKSDQLEKLKIFKTMLERIITFLQVSKNSISPGHKEKLGSYEKQIVAFINTNRPKKPALQQGQLPAPHMQTMQQPPQLTQIQSHENQMNPQLQSMNLQGSVPTMPQNSMLSLQHNSMSLSGLRRHSQT